MKHCFKHSARSCKKYRCIKYVPVKIYAKVHHLLLTCYESYFVFLRFDFVNTSYETIWPISLASFLLLDEWVWLKVVFVVFVFNNSLF